MITFRIRARKSKDYFQVMVYDTPKALQKAGLRHDLKMGKIDDFGHRGVLGLVHPFERLYFEGKKEIRHPNIGIIRITKDAGSEIASHEVVHAAMWQYRLQNNDTANFGKQNGIREENFAHLYGQLFRSLVTKMYKKGVWQES